MPSAVTSGVMRAFALLPPRARSGAYATRSTITPSAPARSMAPKVPATPAKSGALSPPRAAMRKRPAYAPIMKTSLCAKLMSFRMPYTIVYPRATRAIIDPWASPVTRALAIFSSIAATIARVGAAYLPFSGAPAEGAGGEAGAVSGAGSGAGLWPLSCTVEK